MRRPNLSAFSPAGFRRRRELSRHIKATNEAIERLAREPRRITITTSSQITLIVVLAIGVRLATNWPITLIVVAGVLLLQQLLFVALSVHVGVMRQLVRAGTATSTHPKTSAPRKTTSDSAVVTKNALRTLRRAVQHAEALPSSDLFLELQLERISEWHRKATSLLADLLLVPDSVQLRVDFDEIIFAAASWEERLGGISWEDPKPREQISEATASASLPAYEAATVFTDRVAEYVSARG